MYTSVNMSLVIWSESADSYNHAQLAENLVAIDNHDHTAGKGVLLGQGSIADGSIVASKLAANAVTTAAITDGAVTDEKLANSQIPLGTLISWWRPSTNVDIPAGWIIPTGQTLYPADHDYGPLVNPGDPTNVTITAPDLRNRFALGATLTNPASDPNSAPAIGQLGGTNTINLAHTHELTGAVVRAVSDEDRHCSVIIRNWDYFGWPWDHHWWGYSAHLETDSELSIAQDIRPSYIGVLYLLKVKKS